MGDPVTADQLIAFMALVYTLQSVHIFLAWKQIQVIAKLREDFTVIATIVKSCKHCPKVGT